MLSVIIPTIQKCNNILYQLIKTLVDDDCVGEVIIINNKPEVPLFYNHEKVTIIVPFSNMYVNPSWNYGKTLASYQDMALINDDLLVCRDFCSKVISSDVYNQSDTGLIGATNKYIKNITINGFSPRPVMAENESIIFEELPNHMNTADWCIAIFGKKQNFYTIPDDLKIIYGDNYILYKNKLAGKKNYYIQNCPILHVHSPSSASAEFLSIIVQDMQNQAKYFS